MFDPITLGLIGAGTGLLKSEFMDRPQQMHADMMRAEELRYSPWTKMKVRDPAQHVDQLGTALQGGFGGLAQGQKFAEQEAANKKIGQETAAQDLANQHRLQLIEAQKLENERRRREFQNGNNGAR